MPRISSQKRDAVDAIEQYAMPVFRRVAEARGIAWPWEGLKPSRRARDVQCVGAVKGDGAPTAPNPSADSNDGTTSRS
jgi:hypothetical protein